MDSTEKSAQATTISELVAYGYEDTGRAMYGDETVDDWFRAGGEDPDVMRGHTLDGQLVIVDS